MKRNEKGRVNGKKVSKNSREQLQKERKGSTEKRKCQAELQIER